MGQVKGRGAKQTANSPTVFPQVEKTSSERETAVRSLSHSLCHTISLSLTLSLFLSYEAAGL